MALFGSFALNAIPWRGLMWLALGLAVYAGIDHIRDTFAERDRLLQSIAEMQNTLAERDRTIAEKNDALTKWRQHDEDTRRAIAIAETDRQILEHQLSAIREERKRDQDVFTKERGRYESLMQRKAGLVVRLANRGTERVRLALEQASRPPEPTDPGAATASGVQSTP